MSERREKREEIERRERERGKREERGQFQFVHFGMNCLRWCKQQNRKLEYNWGVHARNARCMYASMCVCMYACMCVCMYA